LAPLAVEVAKWTRRQKGEIHRRALQGLADNFADPMSAEDAMRFLRHKGFVVEIAGKPRWFAPGISSLMDYTVDQHAQDQAQDVLLKEHVSSMPANT